MCISDWSSDVCSSDVERLHWKLDLIARVDARIHAAPMPAPGPAEWRSVTDKRAAYRHLEVEGHYRHGATWVLANTELGPAFWERARASWRERVWQSG